MASIEIRKCVPDRCEPNRNYTVGFYEVIDQLEPGRYRLISEEKIEVLHDKLLDAVRSPHTIHGMCRMAMLNDLIKEAGLGKEPQ